MYSFVDGDAVLIVVGLFVGFDVFAPDFVAAEIVVGTAVAVVVLLPPVVLLKYDLML